MTNYEKLKIGSKIATAVAFVIAAVGLFFYAGAYSDSIANQSPSITVSGTGKVIAKPDVARFSYGVRTEGGKDIASLTKQNNDKTNKIIAFLKEQGIPAEDIKTINYSMTPRYQSYRCGGVLSAQSSGPAPEIANTMIAPAASPVVCPPSEIVGYSFDNTVEVTVRDFEKKNLSTLLSGVVSNGATNVSQLRFELDDPASARLLAKAQAISKAKTEAKRLASESGISLGRILSIDEYGSPIPYYATKGAFGMGGAVDSMVASAPPIQAGSEDVSVTVNIRYALK